MPPSVRIRRRGLWLPRFEIDCGVCGRVAISGTKSFAILLKSDHIRTHR